MLVYLNRRQICSVNNPSFINRQFKPDPNLYFEERGGIRGIYAFLFGLRG
jgi:hypothetical protein